MAASSREPQKSSGGNFSLENEYNREAIKKTSKEFSKYDARVSSSDYSKKNPHSFTIMDHYPTPEETPLLFNDKFLFVKEENSPWKMYYVIVRPADQSRLIQSRPQSELETFTKSLNAAEFNDDVLNEINAQIKTNIRKATLLKPMEEAVATENTFFDDMQEFVRRLEAVKLQLDEVTRHELEKYLIPYKSLTKTSEKINASASNDEDKDQLNIAEKNMFDVIKHGITTNGQSFISAMQEIENFTKFLNAPRKNKSSIAMLADQNAKSSIDQSMSNEEKRPRTLATLQLQASIGTRVGRYENLVDKAQESLEKNNLLSDVKKQVYQNLIIKIKTLAGNINLATSQNSDSVKQLKARTAIGVISHELRILKSKGVNLETGIFEKYFEYLQSDIAYKKPDLKKAQELRTELQFTLLSFYTSQYITGRTKSTGKSKELRALENFISQMEIAFDEAGLQPIFDKAKNLKEADTFERGLLNVAKNLSSDKFKEFMNTIYNDAKNDVLSLKNFNEKDVEFNKATERFGNIFKIIERIGQNAKDYWQELVNNENVAVFENRGLSLDIFTSLFSVPKDEKIHEDQVKNQFRKRLSQIVMGQSQMLNPPASKEGGQRRPSYLDVSGISPRAASASVPSAIEGLSIEEEKESAPVLEANQSEQERNLLKREIFSVFSKNVLAAEKQIGNMPYDQAEIIRNLINKVNSHLLFDADIEKQLNLLSEDNLLELQNRVISKEADPLTLVKYFYQDFMDAYVDAYALKGTDRQALEIVRNMFNNIDMDLKKISAAAQPLLVDEKLNSKAMNVAVFKSISESKSDFYKKQVNKLFDNLLVIINQRPTGHYEELAFENTLTAIVKMGTNAIEEWNRRAGIDFYELLLYPSQVLEDNKKVLESFHDVVNLPQTELERRQDIVKKVNDAFTRAVKNLSESDFPSQERFATLLALPKAEIGSQGGNLPDRRILTYHLRTFIYSTLMNAYMEGRGRSFGKSVAEPYLKAIINFMKEVDTSLVNNGQQSLIFSDPTIYKRDPIEIANLAFSNAQAVFRNHFPDFIKSLFDRVSASFNVMVKHLGDLAAVEAYNQKDPNSPFYKARKLVVNTLKAIERMDPNQNAKMEWNKLAVIQESKFGLYGNLLVLDPNAKIHDTDVKKDFENRLEIVKLFAGVVSAFDKMMPDSKEAKSFDAAREILVKTFKKVGKLDDQKRKYWDQLIANVSQYSKYPSYGKEFDQLLHLPPAEMTNEKNIIEKFQSARGEFDHRKIHLKSVEKEFSQSRTPSPSQLFQPASPRPQAVAASSAVESKEQEEQKYRPPTPNSQRK